MMDYNAGEKHVYETLRGNPLPEQLDKALEVFVGTKPKTAGSRNYGGGHGGWVHSLSHFTEDLWKLGRLDWVKRLNEIAFNGANELGDSNCCERLVSDFTNYATFDLDPAEFHLTPDDLRWMNWNEYHEYDKARIEHGRFESADDLQRFKLLWELRHPKTFIEYSNEGQNYLVSVNKLRSTLQALEALGVDISEFDGLERRLLHAKLAELEAEMVAIPSKYPELKIQQWNQERLQKAIDMTKSALVE